MEWILSYDSSAHALDVHRRALHRHSKAPHNLTLCKTHPDDGVAAFGYTVEHHSLRRRVPRPIEGVGQVPTLCAHSADALEPELGPIFGELACRAAVYTANDFGDFVPGDGRRRRCEDGRRAALWLVTR